MSIVEIWLHLIINGFHIYVFAQAYRFLFGCPCSFRKTQKFKWEKFIVVLAFFIFFAVNSCLSLWLNNPYVNLASTVLPLIAITFLYPGKSLTKLLSAIFLYLLSMSLESVSLSMLQLVGLSSFAKNGTLVNLSGSLLLFLISQAFRNFRQQKLADSLEILHWIIILCLPISSLLIIVLAYNANYSPFNNLCIVSLLLVINVLVFRIFNLLRHYYVTNYEQNFIKRQNIAYAHEIAVIQRSSESNRALRHDMKNHLAIMRRMVEQRQLDELALYLNQFSTSYFDNEEFVCSGNTEIDSILNFKLSEAKRIGAEINVSVVIPKVIPIRPGDIVSILGNLLDNAIEALCNVENKYLGVELRSEKGMLYIKIVNNYKGTLKKHQQYGITFYQTAKGDPGMHSIGLASVRRAVDGYNGIITIDDQNQQFKVYILLPACL